MKSPHILFTLFITALALEAKMSSTVNITNIRKIIVNEKSITIIGDGTFKSRMVTTQENKNSKSLISGQPSLHYVAKGDSVQYTIQKYTFDLQGKLSEQEQAEWNKARELYLQLWKQSTEIASKLKKGDSVLISIQGSSVNFKHGKLASVTGNGHVQVKQ